MKFSWICLVGVAAIVCLAGCSGGGADAPASSSEAPSGSGGEQDLTKRWGPEEMPDREAEPLQFLYWRVDQMFDADDADKDGRLTPDEFQGMANNFERMDADGDGYVTKKEVIDDMTPQLRERGEVP